MGTILKNSTIPNGGTIDAVYSSAIGIDVHAEVLVCCFEYFETGECRKKARSFGRSCSKIRKFAECDPGPIERLELELTTGLPF